MNLTSAKVGGICFVSWAAVTATTTITAMEAWSEVGHWAFKEDASDEWWLVVLTAIALVGALFAAGAAYGQLVTLRTQVQDAREHTEANRKADMRPWPAFQRTALLPSGKNAHPHFVEITLKNVGLGTAVDIRVEGWVVPVPAWIVSNWGKRSDRAAHLIELLIVRRRPAILRAEHFALSPGESVRLYLQHNRNTLIPVWSDMAWVWVSVACADLDFHGRRPVPPVTRAGRQSVVYRVARVERRLPQVPGYKTTNRRRRR